LIFTISVHSLQSINPINFTLKDNNTEEKLRLLVTEQQELNRQLKESQDELHKLNANKDRLISIIAHDLRSPFNSLLNFSEFLVEDIDELPKEEIKLFAQKINEAANNLFTLLENLLQWSRMESGKFPFHPAKLNLRYKINQVIKLFIDIAEIKKIKIINNVPETCVAFADEDMMFSVIQNLLSNAIKFSKDLGNIIFEGQIDNDTIKISIKDTGIGIKEEDLAKLFRNDIRHSTYGTHDEKGSGLGLMICKEMIEKNSGEIIVSSNFGEGTTFYFTLPLFSAQQN